ncbi:MAG: hypothetical protein HQL22_12180, partial [Candidatus Omnitrophica bacterium]|nr:hypothetical protein [Candidatus Omnitrophota bacterium]
MDLETGARGSVVNGSEELNICRSFRLRYLWAGLWRAVFFKKEVIFYYLILGKNVRWWAKRSNVFSRCLQGRVRVEACPHDVWSMVNTQGSSVTASAAYDGVERFVDVFKATYLENNGSSLGKLNARLSSIQGDLRLWIMLAATHDVFEEILLINVAEWLVENPVSILHAQHLRVIIEKKFAWVELLQSCVTSKRLVLDFVPMAPSMDESVMVNVVYQFCNIMFSWGRSLFKNVSVSPVNTVCSFNEGRPNFHDFDQSRSYSLFWFPSSGISPQQISLFSYDSKEISQTDAHRIKSLGFDVASCEGFLKKVNPWIQRHACSWGAVSTFGAYLTESVRLLFQVRTRIDWRVWRALTVALIRLPYWEDYFRMKKVKILFKPGSLFNHLDIAAKLSGAAIVSYQTSNLVRTMVWHAETCDTFFVWGKDYERAYRTKYSQVRNIIYSGYIFDYVFEPLKKQAKREREAIFGNDIKFVISLFDENWTMEHSIGLIGFKQEMLSLYDRFFKYALEHKDVGLIIKPKRQINDKVLRSSSVTGVALQALEQQGRLKFFGYEKYPAQAGVVSDLVVGLYPDSTAAFECWLAGTCAISYDVTKLRQLNSLYIKERNRVVLDDGACMLFCF